MSSPRLAYTVHPGRGPYLAMLHGFLSSSAQWRLNLAALAEVCQPVTIDLWGHGASPAPESIDAYAPASYVEALETIRRELEAEQWFLCGYSLGAGITIRYTHTHADRVHGHIFTNSTSGFADNQQRQLWRREGQSNAQRILDGGLPAIERIAVHPRFAKRFPAEIYTALVDDAALLAPVGIANGMQATTPNASIRSIAAENPKPALLCFGRHEKRFAPLKDWAAQNMADLSVVDLDAAHGVNIEDPDGFNQAVCNFLRQHSP